MEIPVFFLNFRGLRGDRFKLCVPKYSENIVYADYFEGANKFETYGWIRFLNMMNDARFCLFFRLETVDWKADRSQSFCRIMYIQIWF